METTDYVKKRRAEFMTYLEKIKSFGYKVRISNSIFYNYAYIIDKHNVVGYCQMNDFFGIDLGTKHYPTEKCGTGFSVERGVLLDALNPSMIESCFCIAPRGYDQSYHALVKKIVIDNGSKESQRVLDNSVEI